MPGHNPTTGRAAVLLTGCSSGIGRAAALAFHRAGHPVYATARRPESIRDLADAGLTTLAVDVTDEPSMVAAVERVEADRGSVGVLVNNAGYGLQAPVEEAPMAEVRRQFETNVFGLVRLTQLVLPGMRRAGHARIVNVGSMGGRFTFPGGGFYHASKHAVEAVTDALRYEVTGFGIGVVLVQPGPVNTEFGGTAVATIDGPEAGGTGDRSAVEDAAAEGAAAEGAAADPYGPFRRAVAARYARAYDGSRASLAVSPDRVAATILKAATTARPRPRYAVGAVARSLITLRRLTPDVVFDEVMRRNFPTPERLPR